MTVLFCRPDLQARLGAVGLGHQLGLCYCLDDLDIVDLCYHLNDLDIVDQLIPLRGPGLMLNSTLSVLFSLP